MRMGANPGVGRLGGGIFSPEVAEQPREHFSGGDCIDAGVCIDGVDEGLVERGLDVCKVAGLLEAISPVHGGVVLEAARAPGSHSRKGILYRSTGASTGRLAPRPSPDER